MSIAIAAIGFATAQGNTAQILEAKTPRPATALPWTPNKWNLSRICHPAIQIESSLSGAARWQALAKRALDDLGELSPGTPLLVASCNGDASQNWEQAFDTTALLDDTPWAGERLPVFSSSCASGIHALYAARQLLLARVTDEVVVIAADILSPSNHDNFESLRVLAAEPSPPWQSTSQGFILGEAAVVLKVVRASGDDQAIDLALRSDLDDYDGLSRALEALSPSDPSLILGQGTGPFQNDTAELTAFSTFVDEHVPLATPLSNFGHTLGASGLLAVALGALSCNTRSLVPSLTSNVGEALDGRALCRGGPLWAPGQVLSTCRALNGACAATIVGAGSHAKAQRHKDGWRRNVRSGALMNETLRRMASQAKQHRPMEPPDVLIVRMEKPLSPPASAIIGDRLLPSAVLEITPGFTSQLVARCWGFSGPSLCLVGDVDHDVYGLKSAFQESGLSVFQVNLRGSGDNRAIEWNA
jgi:Beta-ketoacyl synthase, C-terminal domain